MSRMVVPGISDCDFIRGDIPMTKEEVRAVTLSKLKLNNDSVLIDIGAGTGSVSIEAGLLLEKGRVIAVESKSEGIELIKKNAVKFNVSNIEIIKGNAPECLSGIKGFDRVFIGGSGGFLEGILDFADKNIADDGVIVVNAVTLETLWTAKKYFNDREYRETDIVSVNIAKARAAGNYSMFDSYNTVFILSARRRLYEKR